MSAGICRIEKCKGGAAIAGAAIHDRRERNHSNSNPDIDFSKSKNNYCFCDNPADLNIGFNEYIDKQLADRYKGKRAIRKDAVKMFEVLFTSDNEFFNDAEKGQQYLEACYEWACNRWGAQNVVSAYVHMDEDTPHLHMNIIPLTEDGRLSAKACIGDGSKALQQLQDDFFNECSSQFGLDRGARTDLDNGEKAIKHKTVSEYKRNRDVIQAQRATIERQAEILHAGAENAPQGKPVPFSKRLSFSQEEIQSMHNQMNAAAVTKADLEEQAKALCFLSSIFSYQLHQAEKDREAAEREREQAEKLKKEAERKENEISDTLSRLQSREKNLDKEIDAAAEKQNRHLTDMINKYEKAYDSQGKDIQEKNRTISEKNREIERLEKLYKSAQRYRISFSNEYYKRIAVSLGDKLCNKKTDYCVEIKADQSGTAISVNSQNRDILDNAVKEVNKICEDEDRVIQNIQRFSECLDRIAEEISKIKNASCMDHGYER